MTNSIYSWPIPTVLRNLANGVVDSDAATIAQVNDAVANGYGNSNVAVYLPTNTADVGAANVDASGNVTANYFIGDGSLLTGLPANYGNTQVAAYLPTYTGELAGGNANITGTVTANAFVGDGSQLTGLYGNANVANYLPTFTGNITATTVSTTGNITGLYIKGDGSQLTGLPANYGNTEVADFLPTYTGDLAGNSVSVAGNVTAAFFVGDGRYLTNIYGNANVANFLPTFTGNLTAENVEFQGNSRVVGESYLVGNVNVGTNGAVTSLLSYSSNGTTVTINLTVPSLPAAYSAGEIVLITGTGIVGVDGLQTITVATSNTFEFASTVAAIGTTSLTLGSQASAQLLNSISAAGNVTVGRYFIGDGSKLSNITYANITNAYSNTNVSNYLPIYTGNILAGNANITGALVAGTTITATGNLAGGNISTAGLITSTGNVTGGNIRTAGLVSATGNVIGGNVTTAGLVSATGTITGGNFSSAGNATITGNITGGNVSTAGIVTATGNVTGGNLVTAGLATITGNVISGNVSTAGLVTAAGNVTGANLVTAGIVTATGNVTGGNLVTAGLATITGNVQAGNVRTAGLVSATGNVTGGNITTAGLITSTGNVTGGNITTAGLVSATGNVTGAYIIGNGSLLTNLPIANIIANGNSNVSIPTSGGNITMAVNNTATFNMTPNSVAMLSGAGVTSQGIQAVAIGQNAAANTQGTGAVAVGAGSGTTAQGAQSVAVGFNAGTNTQGTGAVAIGSGAAATSQGTHAVAVGTNAGSASQGTSAVAVGYNAGSSSLGTNSVAIGAYAGQTLAAGAIALNATGAALNGINAGLYVNPIRNDLTNIANVAFYNASTKEVTYANTISLAGNITGNYILGNGSQLTGMYSNTDVSNYLPIYTGNIAAGNITASGNITTNGFVSNSMSINGNAQINGNLTVSGNIDYVNVQDLSVGDPLIFVGANNTSDIVDLGLMVKFNDGVQQYGGFVRDHTDGVWKLFSNVITAPTTDVDFSNAIYSTMQAGSFVGDGSQLTGMYANANVADYLPTYTGNIKAGNISVTGGITGAGGNSSIDNIKIGFVTPSTGSFTNVTISGTAVVTGNVSGGNLNTSGDVSSLGNIGAVGYVSAIGNVRGSNIISTSLIQGVTLSASGNVLSANLTTAGIVTAVGNVIGGNVVTAGLVSGGSVSTAGNVTGGNLVTAGIVTGGSVSTAGNVTGSFIIGNGSLLSNISAANIIGAYGNSNVTAYLPTYTGNLSPGNITVTSETNLGNIANVTITGGSNNQVIVTDGAGNLSFGNVVNVIPAVHFSANATANNQTFSNTVLQGYTANTDMTLFYNGALLDSSYYTLSGDTVTVNTPLYTGDNIDIIKQFNGSFNTVINSTYANANVAAYLTTYSGNLTVSNISTAGNVIGNIITANSFVGNGSQLSGMYSNTNVSNYLPINTSNVGAGNISASGEIFVATNNAHGGAGYAGIMTMTNTTANATNINKYLRLSNIGALEIVNSAYSNIIMTLKDNGALSVPLRNDASNIGKAVYFNSSTNEITYAAASAGFAGFQAPFSGGNILASYSGQWIQMAGNSTLPQASTIPSGTTLWIMSQATTTPYTLTVFNTGTDFIYLPGTYESTTRSVKMYGGQWIQLMSRGTGEWDVISTNLNTTQKVSSSAVASGSSLSIDNIAISYTGSGVWKVGPVSGSATFAGSTIVLAFGSGPQNNSLTSQSISAGSPVTINTTTAGTAGDSVTLNITDTTNNRMYRATMINTTSSSSYISIERLYG